MKLVLIDFGPLIWVLMTIIILHDNIVNQI